MEVHLLVAEDQIQRAQMGVNTSSLVPQIMLITKDKTFKMDVTIMISERAVREEINTLQNKCSFTWMIQVQLPVAIYCEELYLVTILGA